MIIMEDVTKTYASGSDVPALNGINLHIQEGEFVFIVGMHGFARRRTGRKPVRKMERCARC